MHGTHAVCRLKMSAKGLPAQPVDATQALNLSAGVSNCKVSRGRSFIPARSRFACRISACWRRLSRPQISCSRLPRVLPTGLPPGTPSEFRSSLHCAQTRNHAAVARAQRRYRCPTLAVFVAARTDASSSMTDITESVDKADLSDASTEHLP